MRDVLSRAKVLVDEHHGLSVEAALRMLLDAPQDAAEQFAGVPTSLASREIVDALREAITGPLQAELQELRAEVQGLRAELTRARELPKAASPERIDRALEVEINSGPPKTPKDDVRERELEAQVADLAQRNAAMLAELERRRLEAERMPQRRRWWRLWRQ